MQKIPFFYFINVNLFIKIYYILLPCRNYILLKKYVKTLYITFKDEF